MTVKFDLNSCALKSFLLMVSLWQFAAGADLLMHGPCAETGYDKSIREMTTQVSILGDDDRRPLLELGPKLGMSEAEITQARETTGFVVCPGTTYGNRATGSASMIGNNGQLLTAGHIFKDKQGHFREPLSKCYFQTQGTPNMQIKLALKDGGGGAGLKMNPSYPAGSTSDYAIAKIEATGTVIPLLKGKPPVILPVTNIKPFPVDLSETAIVEGDHMIVISAFGDGMKVQDLTQPIVQDCEARDITPSTSTDVLATCDMNHGSSGSAQLMRNKNGILVIKAIGVAGGGGGDSKAGYSLKNFEFSVGIGVDGRMLRDIREMVPGLSGGNGGVFNDRSL